MQKKILIYNWIPFDEKEGKGGGVTVYTKNLIKYLIEENKYEVFFLSSGRAYDSRREEIYIERTNNSFGDKCHSYQIVNSPVLSSAHLSFPYPEDMQEERRLKDVIEQFLVDISGVDVIHFQNLEGLSLSVLELKCVFPNTRFIYSLHNYYPFCPQVMLWQKNEHSCREKDCGECCIDCMPKDVFKEKVIFNQQIQFDYDHQIEVSAAKLDRQRQLEEEFALISSSGQKLSDSDIDRLQKVFHNYRKNNVAYINRYMDVVLAVSQRVYDLATQFGIDRHKIQVSYIGTEVACRQMQTLANPYVGGLFRICYLGYMRYNKGFYFLLDALEHMPDIMAKQISVVFATKIEGLNERKRLEHLKRKFAEIVNYPGYTHEELPRILNAVHLGIVPSLWEDNLPQVAIEMKAYGIPVLCSDLGGAKELSDAEGFVFEAGDVEDFIAKLTDIYTEQVSLDNYFQLGMRLITMDKHIDELKRLYFEDGYV